MAGRGRSPEELWRAEGEARKNCGGQRSEGSETFSRGGGNEISHTTRAILVKNKKSPGPEGPGDGGIA
ncbi:hypothetical protein HMPREF6123_1319 [Oribacterium sinus F0268]|uniref:Uncharacterized protein n=1 Tax=Oribacterium sinus F0268 TaxID=585501 RepID=C2KXV0_9FIRM|nr:hypothetical protein HMPREF6123_1319 [Oribacterium sinus F0268]